MSSEKDTRPEVEQSTVPVEAPVKDPLLGSLIDQRYQVLSLISRGGMATVYRALDERLDREVALKVMHPHLAESADLVARFRREARATARLTHPGVVAVYDQGVINGSGYLVMELISGPNLRYVLRSQGAFTLQVAFDMVEQILSALTSAHQSGLIHRDVKPENVLVPSWSELKVADFGLARAVSDVTMASTGSVLGTVGYLAPELVTSGEVDPRSDIYSVGIMLYELIAGVLPYQGENPIQIAFAHVHEDIPRLSDRVSWVPVEVDDLLASLCARNPAERPPDAVTALDYVRATYAALDKSVLGRRADVEPSLTEEEISEETQREDRTRALDFGHGTAALPLTASEQEVRELRARRRRRILTVLGVLLVLFSFGGGGTALWYYEWGPGSYIPVPELRNKTREQAIEALRELKISHRFLEDYSDTVEKGSVINTDPVAGAQISKHDTLEVILSRGIEYVSVPNVVAKAEADAVSELRQAKLRVKDKTQEYSEEIAESLVISVNPAAGEKLVHDSEVSLVISKGRKPIEVPNLVGLSQSEAEGVLADLGLLSSASTGTSEDVARGLVASQDPVSGEKRYRNDTINIVISKGPAKVEIPNLFATSPDGAKEKLEALGFVVQIDDSQKRLNLVWKTSPEAGTMAANGSTVTIYVG